MATKPTNRATQRGHDIVVVGASAGGLDVIPKILGKLPVTFAGSIFFVMHVAPQWPSYLADILGRKSKLKVAHARSGDTFERGHVYVAPPDHHLLIDSSRMLLTRGPKENRHRPAVDPLFRSAAEHHGKHVVGLILTGALDDGTAGLHAVKHCGGVTIVQHPDEAFAPGMPLSALKWVQTDYCLPVSKISRLLMKLSVLPPASNGVTECNPALFRADGQTRSAARMETETGPASSLVCPDCSGPLWQIGVGHALHYRCIVGHAFSPQSLLEGENEEIETALWTAVKTLEQRSHLLKQLAARAREQNQSAAEKDFQKRATDSERQAESVRRILTGVSSLPALHGGR